MKLKYKDNMTTGIAQLAWWLCTFSLIDYSNKPVYVLILMGVIWIYLTYFIISNITKKKEQ